MIDPLEAVDNFVKPVAMHVLLARERLESGVAYNPVSDEVARDPDTGPAPNKPDERGRPKRLVSSTSSRLDRNLTPTLLRQRHNFEKFCIRFDDRSGSPASGALVLRPNQNDKCEGMAFKGTGCSSRRRERIGYRTVKGFLHERVGRAGQRGDCVFALPQPHGARGRKRLGQVFVFLFPTGVHAAGQR